MSNLKSKKTHSLEIKSKSKDTVEMIMYGDVSRYDINAKDVQRELKAIDSKINKMDLRLFSGGGDVFEGIAIYNILKRSDLEITVHIDGIAASIASIIMLAGDEIVIGEGSQVMIHRPYCMCMGNATELMGVIERLDRIENEIVKIYENKTGLSTSEIERMMADETWFNDEEAIEFGFVDKKAEFENCFDIAASIKDCEWIRKKELAKKNTEFKNKIGDNINNFNDILARTKA